MNKKSIIIDCDPGHDDAIGIILACASDMLDVKGITTVGGNQTIAKTTNNALRVLNYIGKNIPVAMGADTPMIFQAQRSRGAKLNGKGVIGQLKAYVPIMVPLITNSILMANNLAVSMMNRGYGASSNWTSLHEITMQRRDYLVIASTVLMIALSFILKYTYHFGVI